MSLLQKRKRCYERVGPNTVMFYQPEEMENKQWKAATLSIGKLSGKIMYLRTDLKIKTTPLPEQ